MTLQLRLALLIPVIAAPLAQATAQSAGRDTVLLQLCAKAEQGDAESQYKLGYWYGVVTGVEKNDSIAVSW